LLLVLLALVVVTGEQLLGDSGGSGRRYARGDTCRNLLRERHAFFVIRAFVIVCHDTLLSVVLVPFRPAKRKTAARRCHGDGSPDEPARSSTLWWRCRGRGERWP
jgi:hypothetical protein